MYALKDGAPRKLHYYNTVPKKQIDQLQKQFRDQKISISQLFWKYQSMAFDEIEYPEDKTAPEIWKKLTKVQKTILSISIFIGQVDNGGVWQFFYNKPTYAIVVADALDEVNPHNLIVTHYEKPLEDFIKMVNSGAYTELMELASNPALSHEERWNLFQSGKVHVPNHQEFEDFFYQEDNKVYLYKLLTKYVEQNMAKLLQVDFT